MGFELTVERGVVGGKCPAQAPNRQILSQMGQDIPADPPGRLLCPGCAVLPLPALRQHGKDPEQDLARPAGPFGIRLLLELDPDPLQGLPHIRVGSVVQAQDTRIVGKHAEIRIALGFPDHFITRGMESRGMQADVDELRGERQMQPGGMPDFQRAEGTLRRQAKQRMPCGHIRRVPCAPAKAAAFQEQKVEPSGIEHRIRTKRREQDGYLPARPISARGHPVSPFPGRYCSKYKKTCRKYNDERTGIRYTNMGFFAKYRIPRFSPLFKGAVLPMRMWECENQDGLTKSGADRGGRRTAAHPARRAAVDMARPGRRL